MPVRSMRWLLAALFAASALLCTVGLPPQPAAFAAGQRTEAVSLDRIAAIGGDVTEILYALGLGDNIVAVDTTSQYPPEALQQKKSLGYMRALSAEGVLSTNPTLILASAGAGPPEVVKALKSASVPYVEIPDDPSPAGIVEKILAVARIARKQAEGAVLADRIRQDLARLDAARAAVGTRRKVLFVLALQGGRVVVGGRGSSADAMLRLAGAENAADAVFGYKPVSDEGILEMAPEVILLMRREPGGLGHLQGLRSTSGTPAGSTGSLREVDGVALLAFGPRTPRAIHDLMLDLYPELRSGLKTGKP